METSGKKLLNIFNQGILNFYHIEQIIQQKITSTQLLDAL